MIPVLVIAAASFLLSYGLTKLFVGYATDRALLDIPNERSSHRVPTPRGGGIAIVAVSSVLIAVCAATTGIWSLPALWAVLGASLLAALIGFIDDRRGLSARFRAIALLILIGVAISVIGLPDLAARESSSHVLVGALAACLVVVVSVWFVNLFNFMDGIDGIATSQAVFMLSAASWISSCQAPTFSSLLPMVCVCASAAGFLLVNWAPARVFLGDVGSYFLGTFIALAALWTAGQGTLSLWTWIVLGGLFIADATATLTIRVARGKQPTVAHRSHVYQRLARRFGRHDVVTAIYAVTNACIILPLAIAVHCNPSSAVVISMATISALALFAVLLGAGREPEQTTTSD
jgi:Fuc2NAc and GlcNAc transferase